MLGSIVLTATVTPVPAHVLREAATTSGALGATTTVTVAFTLSDALPHWPVVPVASTQKSMLVFSGSVVNTGPVNTAVPPVACVSVSYTHLRAHETPEHL